jgi:fructose-1,6-bisphosphatase/inositol monophosphatase family enzyme
MTDFSKEFEFARTTILKASDIALSYFENNPTFHAKPDNSIVTQADEEIEAFIRAEFEKTFPDYGFIGEESKADRKEINWIVDPIDGTSAFARSIPSFSNVMALTHGNDVLFSLIYHPVTKRLYWAKKGEGAYRDDKRITVSNIESLGKDYGIVSLTHMNFYDERYKDHLVKIAEKHRTRIAHSSGVESSYLASGSIDVLIKLNQPIWDTAPECFLMQEAGAIIKNHVGDEFMLDFSAGAKHDYIAMTPNIYKNEAQTLFFPKQE